MVNELEAIGMPRGPKFDQVIEQVFALQLNGRGKTPEERIKTLRKLSGIKEAPKKKEKEKKSAKAADKRAASEAIHAKHKAAAEKAAAKQKPKPAAKPAGSKKAAK